MRILNAVFLAVTLPVWALPPPLTVIQQADDKQFYIVAKAAYPNLYAYPPAFPPLPPPEPVKPPRRKPKPVARKAPKTPKPPDCVCPETGAVYLQAPQSVPAPVKER